MEGYSSDGSTSSFTPQMPNEIELANEFDFTNQSFEKNGCSISHFNWNDYLHWDGCDNEKINLSSKSGEPTYWNDIFWDDREVDKEKIELATTSGGLTYSQTSQYLLDQVETSEASYQIKSGGNQVETSEASYQTKSGGRLKLTPAQIKENKRRSDCRYRQKLKRTAAEQTKENEHLKEENEKLKTENNMLKWRIELLTCPGPLLAEAQEREDTCIAQSTSRQLDHPSVSVQVATRKAAQTMEENEHLKEENEGLKAEIKKLKEHIELLTCHGQLPTEARQREDTSIAQSTSKQLDQPSLSVQVSSLEMNDLQNLCQNIPINAVATSDNATENQNNSRTGTCYDITTIKLLMKEIDEDDQSNVCFSDFTGLDGERMKIGKYNFPLSLRPVVEGIIACYGDISATSKMNLNVVEVTYILFCASLKEMGDLQLEEVSKDRILKWGYTIKDALRINFKVDFAMDHLKKIAHAYIGRIESQELKNMTETISKLEADLNTRKEELAKRKELSKKYMDAAEEFNGKSLSLFT